MSANRRIKATERNRKIQKSPPSSIDFYGRAVDVKDDRYNDLHCRPMVTARQIVSAYVLNNRYHQERIEHFAPGAREVGN